MRSQRMGLRLYGMAEEPIWFFSNGSSISLKLASRRRSVANFMQLWAMPASALRMKESTLRL